MLLLAAVTTLLPAQTTTQPKVLFCAKPTAAATTHELYTIRTNGLGLARLTTNNFDKIAPAISPDNTLVAYICNDLTKSNIQIMPIGGGTPYTVPLTNRAFSVQWGDNQTLFYLSSNNVPGVGGGVAYRLWRVGTNGSANVLVFTNRMVDFPAGPYSFFVNRSNGMIYIPNYDFNAGASRLYYGTTNQSSLSGSIAFTTTLGDEYCPAVSPDGAHLAFTADINFDGSHTLWISGTNGGVATKSASSLYAGSPAWIDSNSLAFTKAAASTSGNTYYEGNIARCSASGSNVVSLTLGTAVAGRSAFPVVFVSTNSGSGGGTNNNHDFFAGATVISGISGSVNATNNGATLEPGEPTTADGATVDNSIWYKWSPDSSGVATFDTFGSDFDTVLAVYTGTSVSNLTLVAANNDFIPLIVVQSQVSFTAYRGTDYYIQVAGNANPAPGSADHGNVVLSWNETTPTIPSGTFFVAIDPTFAAFFGAPPDVVGIVADTESSPPGDQSVSPSLGGARVVVTRTAGSSGRVQVPYTITASYAAETTLLANPGGGLPPLNVGTLVFDDYQMSMEIVIPIAALPDGNSGFLTVTLGQPILDPLESSDLMPPLLGDAANNQYTTVRQFVFSASLPDPNANVDPTTSVFNFERATFRVNEKSPGYAAIYVTRNSQAQDFAQAVTVDYTVADPQIANGFPLMAGSDYAKPTWETTTDSDFAAYPNPQGNPSGTLSWAAGDPNPQIFYVPINPDVLVEFNEDIFIYLSNAQPPPPNPPTNPEEGAVTGQVSFCWLTILFDDQPPGAVDRNWNVEGSPASNPPFLDYPGTKGGVSDSANGNAGEVFAAVAQPDGKTILAGNFNSFDSTPYNRIVRLLNTGYQDPTFLVAPNIGANSFIATMALQPDGKILIGGDFTAFNGLNRHHIARLNADGTVDNTFNPGVGADAVVWSLALQANGQIIIGGEFTSINGTNMNHVARLNADGTLDTAFNPGIGPNGPVYAVAADPNGNVFIGGNFDFVSQTVSGGVARLKQDGTFDTTFNVGIGTFNSDTGQTDPVNALALQPDGKLLVGGSFEYVEMLAVNGLVRLNTDGTLDTGTAGPLPTPAFATLGALNGTHNPFTGIADSVNVITVNTNGTILIGGDFTTINQTRRIGIARLFPDGSLDTSFMDVAYNQYAGVINHYHNPDAIMDATYIQTAAANIKNNNWTYPASPFYPQGSQRNAVYAIAVEPGSNQNVIVGGDFLRVGGGYTRDDIHPRSNVARLIGGSVIGPGNIEFAYPKYSVDKNANHLYVSLTRTNGILGIASATISSPPGASGPGIASLGQNQDFDLGNNVFPTWPHDGNAWELKIGYGGPNFNIGVPPPNPSVDLTIYYHTNITGNLTANLDLAAPDGSSFTLGGEFIPLGTALGAQQASPLTIIDPNFVAGTISFSAPIYYVSGSSNTAIITVTRTGGSTGTVQVNCGATPGTATTANFTPAAKTLTFSPGVLSQTFSIVLKPGTVTAADKTVNLLLYGLTGGGTYGQSNAVLTIVDSNLGSTHVAFAFGTNGINENLGIAPIRVNRLGSSSGTVTVTAITQNGTAQSPANYIAMTNTLQWNNNDVAPKYINVPIIHDGIYTSNLMFSLRLTNGYYNALPANTVLSYSTITNTTVVITNVDFPGKVQFSSSAYSVKKYGGYALIPVIRTGGSAGSVSVTCSTSDGSASSGVNYTAVNTNLVFADGEVAKYVRVPVINDGQVDGLLSLNLTLSGAVPATSMGSPNAAVLNIIDTAIVNEQPGAPDVTYSPLAGFNGNVYSLALQANNQMLVGGDFTMANGVPRQRLARLNADGTLDISFGLPSSAMGANAQVSTMAIQSDQRIVLGGFFTTFNSQAAGHLARLNYDGTLDATFRDGIGSGADNTVYAVAQSPVDGKIVVGGAFASINGSTFNSIGRLNVDGTPDLTFNLGGLGANSTVYAVAVQTDGRILIGGDFTTVNGIPASHLARLNTDGSVDITFTNASANDSVRAITIQPDGRILVGGLFTSLNGNTNFVRIARLNSADGSADATFNPWPGANNLVSSIALQTDGRIVLGGQFTRCNGVTRNRVTRLSPNGNVDPTINFGNGANDFVSAVVVQEDVIQGYPTNVPDEKIILGGAFTRYNDDAYPRIVRIYGGSQGGSGAFGFSSAAYQVDETGTNAFVTITRAGGTSGTNSDGSGDILVPFATSDGSAHAGVNYGSVSTNVVFPMGEVQQTVMIPVIHDGVITPDLTVNLAVNPQSPTTYGNQPTAVLTIINSDSSVNFSTATYQVPKNIINSVAVINVLRQGSTNGTASVVFSTTTFGTAVEGVDFTPVKGKLLTFNPGITNIPVMIPIINNGLPEGNRTVTMELTNVTGSTIYSPSNAVLTIIDTVNAPGMLAFASANVTVSESGTNAYITVVRTNGASGIVNVSYQTVPGTAQPGVNYVTTANTLTFADGVTTGTIVVPLVNNNFVQGPVSFGVTLFNPTGGATLGATTNEIVTVLDNDAGIAFVAATNTIPEDSGSVVVSIQRIGSTNDISTAQYATADGTAHAGVNYVAVSGALAFAPGEVFKSVIVPVMKDPQVTGDLNFAMNLSSPGANTQLVNPSTTAVILQDADAGLRFATNTMSVSKNSALAIIKVFCTNPRVEPVFTSTNVIPLKVNYATADGTAVAGVNYQAVNGTLVFTNGIGTNSFTVPIINNGLITGDKSFTVSLSGPTAPGQLVAPSTETIIISESNPGLQFSQSAYTVLKDGVQAVITVKRIGDTNSLATVDYLATNGTAVAGVNFVATSGTLTFTSGVTSQTFSVPIINNNIVQPNHTVLLQLSNPNNGVLVAPSAATLTIVENGGSYVIPAGAQVVTNYTSHLPDGIIHTNDAVQVLFAFRDSAGLDVTNLNAILVPGNGVLAPAPGTNNYGPLKAMGHSVSRPFTFTAQGTNGGFIIPTFALYDGNKPIGTNQFTFTLGTWSATFSNSAAITINDTGAATPYPAIINVSGVGGTVFKTTVTLNKFAHTYPKDVEALVSSPAGISTLIMANAGSSYSVTNLVITFDDAAAGYLPKTSILTTGTNKPTSYPVVLPFP